MEVTASEAIEVGREWGAGAPLAPLVLSYELCEVPENVERNLRRTMESKYTPINELLSTGHDRTISICGFGPSLWQTYTQLSGDILACNGSLGWLLERGVVPKYALFWDAAEIVSSFAVPHHDVTYLVASRCHESVFKALEGMKVFVWHAAGDANMDDLLCEYRLYEPMFGHGSAAATTAMMVSSNLGYRHMNVFGADASFPEGEFTHAKKSVVPEQTLVIYVDGRRFTSTSWLAGQVEDFKQIGPLLRAQGCTIEFYGDGLLPHVARINGFTTHP